MEKNLEEIKKKYTISEEEEAKMADEIFGVITEEKNASEHPVAVIVLAQPGAGKSGLMAYSFNEFPNALEVDIDKFRPYYPRYTEVGENDPEVYEEVTGKFATHIMWNITPRLIDEKYDLILHKTRSDDTLITDTVKPLKDAGYSVILRVMSVHELESKLSVLERSINQYFRRGYCKWVEIDYHNAQYSGVPNITKKMIDMGLIDAVEVFQRGSVPTTPELVYSQIFNPDLINNPHMYDSKNNFLIDNFNSGYYTDAKNAIEKTRESQIASILYGYHRRIEQIKKLKYVEREDEFIDELEQIKNECWEKIVSISNGGE